MKAAQEDCQEAARLLLVVEEDEDFRHEDAMFNSPWHTLYEDSEVRFLYERSWYDVQHQLGYCHMGEPPHEPDLRDLYCRFACHLCLRFVKEYKNHVPQAVAERVPEYEADDFRTVFEEYYNVID